MSGSVPGGGAVPVALLGQDPARCARKPREMSPLILVLPLAVKPGSLSKLRALGASVEAVFGERALVEGIERHENLTAQRRQGADCHGM